MNSANGHSQALSLVHRFFVKLGDVFDDCRYAQRRMAILRTAPDRQARCPDVAPDTYAEFLFRSSGVLLREPPARAR